MCKKLKYVKMKKLINLNVNIILIILLINSIDAKISDKRLCADETCSTIISLAKTKIRYNAPEKNLLSFNPNVEVKVYSKSAGSNKDLWGVDIQGRRGYVPHRFILEHKTYHRDLQYELPTEFEPAVQATEPLPVVPVDVKPPTEEIVTSEEKKLIEEPSPAVQPFEVIDGTKVFLPPNVEENEKVVNKIETPLRTPTEQPVVPVVEKLEIVPPPIPTPEVKVETIVPSLEEKQEVPPGNIPSETVDQKSDEIVESSEDDYDDEESDDNEEDDDEEDENDEEEGDENKESGSIFANLAKMVENAFNGDEEKSADAEVAKEDEKQILEETNSEKEEVPSLSMVPEMPKPQLFNQFPVEETKEEVKEQVAVPESVLNQEIPKDAAEAIEEPIKEIDEIKNVPEVPKIPEPTLISVTEQEKPIDVEVKDNVTETEEKLPGIEETVKDDEKLAEIVPTIEIPVEPVKEELVEATLPPSEDFINKTEEDLPEFKRLPDAPEISENKLDPIPTHQTIPEDVLDQTVSVQEEPEVEELPAPVIPELVKQEQVLEPVPIPVQEKKVEEEIIAPVIPELPKEEHIIPEIPLPVIPNFVQEQLPIPDDIVPVIEIPSEPQQLTEEPAFVPTTITPLEEEIPFQLNEELTTIAPEIISEPKLEEIIRDEEVIEAGIGSIVELHKNDTPAVVVEEENVDEIVVVVDNEPGFFSGMFGKVKSMFGGGEPAAILENENTVDMDSALHKILYPDQFLKANEAVTQENIVETEHCEKLSPNACPKPSPQQQHANQQSNGHHKQHHSHQETSQKISQLLGYQNEDLAQILIENFTEMTDLILYLGISAVTVLIFILGHYCIDKSRKERPLISKLNVLEKTLMVSSKECTILKSDLSETKNKLASIEDNSFGSNEMVIAIKRELENTKTDKISMQEQIITLEKELENAAEAGLELNKMVSELLNNQMGSDSIISSVEELQHQLNEQQDTISSINAVLAEKSRENSELQILLTDQKTIYESQLDEIQRDFEEINLVKQNLETDVLEEKKLLEIKLQELTEEKSNQTAKLTKEMATVKGKLEESQKAIRNSKARVQALEEVIKDSKNGTSDFKDVMKVADIKSDLLAVSKDREQLKERLEGEMDARKLLEDHVKTVSEEVSSLRQEYNLAEKERLEAQTRLEVLSGYFKEKETQLQKELSVKEAMWMQSQGETTSTVERVRTMQDEIQTLKSQNDALRAEIEAQSAAHKAQQNVLETRAHEAWLSSRQVERRFEESRSEASALRRKLTSMAETGNDHSLNGIDGPKVLSAPSPILMENPGSPLMGLPPPPFMPPPFMGHPPPHPFIPPPFMPNEMRPPPLGRLMSPTPNRYSPNLSDRDRYSPDRGRYTPDSRYNDSRYNDALSPYETETDFSPPPSPGPPRRGDYRGERGGGYNKAYSPPPPPTSLDNNRNNNKKKGHFSSGSNDSLKMRRGGGNSNV